MNVNEIKKVLIEGAGTMGSSMAQIFASFGFEVTLHGRHEETLERAKKSISPDVVDRICFTTAWDAFSDADILIENIAENLPVKLEFYQKATSLMKDEAIICTNTSGLSINKLSEAVTGPERFAGFHWFNPPHIIPLIEIISGDKTTQEVADTLYALAEKIEKKPIRVKKDVPGFIANRIQLAILRECLYMKEQGIGDIEDFDKCMKYALGFRYACLGPFEVVDHGGIDIFHHISEYLYADLCDAKEPFGMMKELFSEGNYGVKTGKGFYDYSGDRKEEAVKERNAMYEKLHDAKIQG